MNRLLASAAMLLISSAVSAGTVTISKNELTNEKHYTYTTLAINSDSWMLQIGCNTRGKLYFSATSAIYGFGIDDASHYKFDYKFDDLPIETWGVDDKDVNQMTVTEIDASVEKWSNAEPSFVRRVLKHDKLILGAKRPAPTQTPVFNIKDFRILAKQFSKQCDLVGSAKAKQVATPEGKAKKVDADITGHTHGDRSHSHPLPKQGKAHRHGEGALGR